MKSGTLLTIAFCFCAALRAANIPLITSPGSGPLNAVTNGSTVGALFRVGSSPLSVRSLGIYDGGTPGLAQNHSVGLWTDTGTLLARVDFPSGLNGFSNAGFIYQNLGSPVLLQPGSHYILGADYPVGTVDGCYVNGTLQSETWSPWVTFIQGRYTAPQVGFVFPNFGVGGLSYVGANAQFVVVPEPGDSRNVQLQQPTATFSQESDGDFTIARAINGTVGDDKGWAVSPALGAQTAVFETTTNIGFAGGTSFTFILNQSHSDPQHTLGRFRLSVSTDERTNFADGLLSGGDVTANWFVLVPESATTANGTVLSVLPDGSALASDPSPPTDVYAVTTRTFLTGITGIRLEALTDPSLPHGGPGRDADNGSFVLSEFQVMIEPVTNLVVITNTIVATNTVSFMTLREDVNLSGVSPRATRLLTRQIQQTERRLQQFGNAVRSRIGPINSELAEKIRAEIEVLIGGTEQ